ncbi:MAG: mechanosensitive ion channel protein MscS [Candidatus Andersenbacteria bacterium CG10_big_fil_rev_8_21_14_0_10_54_11]|uniref:Mechanosensitive ion channel protein MscS n=1 Tax=Candidatus Andersenbacteria bacterium CG10_big_fil_rev_8_21_14_0_10_54_11 TaxID=1974485 RepID=A0A2M6WYS8_9BACT|nr:MAG: mechanosensitive ion channel protein MscS [Candidatus Andersenbacteria bacterium CG10_big_fil_rev_8_21_14_0_10_54_11]
MALQSLVAAAAGQSVLGNTVSDYTAALLIFVVFVAAAGGVQWLLLRYFVRLARRTDTAFDDAMVAVVQTIKPPLYFLLGFYLALHYLRVTGFAERVVNVLLLALLVYQAVAALQILIDYFVQRRLIHAEDRAVQSAARVVKTLSSIVLWSLGFLFLLSNFGIDVTSLIAGLGIGGIAIALAAQNILGDLFSSLSIYFDKPFVPGDFIIFGDYMGTVQEVGIKTTRLTSLSGEEIVVPNTEITSVNVRNFGRMKERRVEFSFGVTYQASSEQLQTIPGIVREAVEQQKQTRFNRCHFHQFADFSLHFEAVYHMETKEYSAYMDAHQAILLSIKEAFEREGIEMAYPTRTVYVHEG